MGSSESTGRSNRSDEKEERQPENSSSDGGSLGAGIAVAAAAAGTVMAVWGVSRLISGSSDSDSKEKDDDAMKIKAHGMDSSLTNFHIHEFIQYKGKEARSIWFPPPSGLVKMNTDSKEKDDDAMKIKAHRMDSSLTNFHINEFIQYEGKGPCSIWSPPPSGLVKMNTDGACNWGTKGKNGCVPPPGAYPHPINQNAKKVKRSPAGYAGILRNEFGEWIVGFQGFLGMADSLTAEIHGIHKGLKLLVKLKYRGSPEKKHILESDCLAAVKWIKGEGDNKGKSKIIDNCWGMIIKCRQLAMENNISVEHIDRNANQCADTLACIAVQKEVKYREIPLHDKMHAEVKHLVRRDIRTVDRTHRSFLG